MRRNELSTYAFGGEHERGRYFFEYTAAYSVGEQTYPHRRELLWRSKDKDAEAPPGTLNDSLSSTKSDNYDYLLEQKINPGLVKAYLREVAAVSRTDATRRIPQSITSDYSVSEDIYAGYGQAPVTLGAVTDVLVRAAHRAH